MKKFLLSVFCMLSIMNYAYADEAKFDFTAPSGLTPSITDDMFSDGGNDALAFNTDETTFTNNGVTLNTTQGSTVSRIWKSAKGVYDFRVYKTATMTIAAPEGGVITAIAFDGSTVNSFSANNGTVDGKNWTGSASSVVFKWADNAKTQKINTVTVTFSTDGGTVTPDPEEPEGGEGEGEGEGETTYLTIAEVLAAGAGEAATKGTVVATYARGFLMNDGTGSILVFQGTSPAVTTAVGDAVTVSGTTSMYGGFLQFGTGAVVEKTGTATVSHPTATVMDGAAMDAYLAAPVVKYVEYTGTLTISGNYYNVVIEGASTAIGSIQYPNTGLVTAASGDVVKVTGYTIGISGSKYINTMAVKVEAVEDSGNEGEGEGDGDELEVTDISDIIDAGASTDNVKAQGTIVATYARGFLLDDGTGSILVYLGSDGGNAVGEIVTVEGTTSLYGGLLQFAAGSVVTRLTTTTVSYPAATAMDGAAMDAYLAAPAIKYVEYTGTLTVNGNYYNVAVEGAATAIGSIQYPQDAIKANLTNGAVVKVTGYTIGVSSKYVNTMAVSVEVIGEGGGEEPEEPEVPTETQEYTVAEALAAYVDGQQIPAIVTGYIVGTINGQAYTEGCNFSGVAESATNLLIADNAEETNPANCMPVQLPKGDVRSALNLVDNPDNYKKQIKLTGSLERYFSVAGLKSVKAYEFTGTTGIENVKDENGKVKTIFDLTGRRVENITAPGIYIVGGKKVLVK